jgi:hypothetical protein
MPKQDVCQMTNDYRFLICWELPCGHRRQGTTTTGRPTSDAQGPRLERRSPAEERCRRTPDFWRQNTSTQIFRPPSQP